MVTTVRALPPLPTRLSVRDCYDVGEVARLLGVAPATIYSHLKRGTLTGYARPIGQGTLLPKSEIDRLIPGDVA